MIAVDPGARPVRTQDWPAATEALNAGRALIQRAAPHGVVIACDHDVDGLSSAVLVARAVERLGGAADIVPVARGEHIHVAAYRDRVAAILDRPVAHE